VRIQEPCRRCPIDLDQAFWLQGSIGSVFNGTEANAAVLSAVHDLLARRSGPSPTQSEAPVHLVLLSIVDSSCPFPPGCRAGQFDR